MAKLYRCARAGHIDTREAARLAYVLTALSRMVEVDVLEQRIVALEKAHGQLR